MEVKTVRTNWADRELNQNTHIIIIGNKCIIVDAGASLEDIMPIIGNREVEAILITHAHYDHIWHIESYDTTFSCPIYMHEKADIFLKNPEYNLSKYFGANKTFNLHNVHYIKGKENLNIAGVNIQPIYTPGHSEDSMCYLFEDGTLFSGDTIFARAVGRTDLITGNPNRLIVSLGLLMKLDFNEIYTGHLRSTNKQEQEKNVSVWIRYIKANLLKKHSNYDK